MNKFYSSFIIILFLNNILYAKTATLSTKNLELINIIGQQRMLSQKITKAYLYAGHKVSVDKANRQLRVALNNFYKTYSTINTSTKSVKVKRVMSFIKKSSDKFKSLSKKKMTTENTKLILALSEEVLAKSKNIASLLKNSLQQEAYDSVTHSTQQQMLAEKIAKYYIVNQSKVKDSGIEKQMRNSILLFSKNHKILMKNKRNTKVIKKRLRKVDQLWKLLIDGLYKKDKLSYIVFSLTDDINKEMGEITKLYMVAFR
jgi:hypothetical protein